MVTINVQPSIALYSPVIKEGLGQLDIVAPTNGIVLDGLKKVRPSARGFMRALQIGMHVDE